MAVTPAATGAAPDPTTGDRRPGGLLVAIVGPDGAGKSTVTAHAAERLAAGGHPVRRTDRWHIVDNPAYPVTGFLRPPVADLRLRVAEMPNPPRFLFLMWSIGMAVLGRRDAAAPEVELFDGYWMKHAASEVVYGLDQGWVESVVAGLPRPDVVVYLRLTAAEAWRRKRHDVVPYECGMDPSCAETSFRRHQERIGALLDEWSGRYGWTEVDATAPVDDVISRLAGAVAAARR